MRFYYPQINERSAELCGDAHTHAAYSLRVRPNDYITVFDGKGNDYLCRIKCIKKDRTELEIIQKELDACEAKLDISLYMSVIKQDKFELTVQKATELGVRRIIPVYTTYTQRGGRLNHERLNKIAISACEQCGRSRIPTIEQSIEFEELLSRTCNTYTIFPWEKDTGNSLSNVIDKSQQSISVFIGSEGGITKDEKNKLIEGGAKAVTLGRRILRAETAAIATLSVLCYEMGEWDL